MKDVKELLDENLRIYREKDKLYEIVERLKKLLIGQTDSFSFTGKFLREEILGEKK